MPGCHVQPEQMFNLIWGYNGQYQERAGDTSMPAGGADKDLTPVPAGQVWVVNCIWAKNDNRGCQVHLKVVCGANIHTLKYETTPAAVAVSSITGAFVLKEGDFVRVTFAGLTLNDDCYWGALGYKMVLS